MEEILWVYFETRGGEITDASIRVLGLAGEWVKQTGGRLEGICINGDRRRFNNLPGPLSKVYRVAGEALGEYTAEAYCGALERLVSAAKPTAVLFPSSTQGDDLASMLGAALDVGALLGASEARRLEDRVVATRVEFEGKVAVDYELRGKPAILSLAEGPEDVLEEAAAGEIEIEEIHDPITSGPCAVRVLRTELSEKTVDLRKARVIVAVGAGAGDAAGVQNARELAALLGGELGATRAAVDAGWLSHDRQIGQTGVKVRPDLYVACGISGVAQHRVGMIDSGTIVSINIDPQAPIFRFSHFCVEGDLRAVLPKLIELLGR